MLTLNRFSSQLSGTYGAMIFNGKPVCYTLELPWKNNARNISCIPLGEYQVYKANSLKYGACFRLNHVPDRDAILIHAGNYLTDTQGCILVGLDCSLTGVQYSRLALARLLDLLPETFTLKIGNLMTWLANNWDAILTVLNALGLLVLKQTKAPK